MENPTNKHKAGMRGQHEAEQFLRDKGYIVSERNYRIRTGEIDLIAKAEGYIIFIEVKYRRGLSYGYPREAVGRAKQKSILRTALHYISTRGLTNQDFRFDVVEVLEKEGRIFVNHIENAFEV